MLALALANDVGTSAAAAAMLGWSCCVSARPRGEQLLLMRTCSAAAIDATVYVSAVVSHCSFGAHADVDSRFSTSSVFNSGSAASSSSSASLVSSVSASKSNAWDPFGTMALGVIANCFITFVSGSYFSWINGNLPPQSPSPSPSRSSSTSLIRSVHYVNTSYLTHLLVP